MKQSVWVVGVALVCGLLAVACGGGGRPGTVADTSLEKVNGEDTYCVDLLAGQTTDAGDVCVTLVDNEDLCVEYTTAGDWELDEVHLYVGTREGMPQTRKGNPKIGNFPYASGAISGSTTYKFTIALADIQIGVDENGDAVYADCDSALFVAAHAALSKDNGDGTYDTETGWGDGDPLVDRGSWATGFDIQLECDTTEPPEPEDGCETAFAYGGLDATCFLDIDEDADGKDDFNRWGWTNAISEGASVTWDVYAGAGQCDTDKGTLVGTLTVTYENGTLTATYDIDSPYTMTESHIYAGSAILASDVNGDFTVAPGQYPQITDHGDGVSTVTYTFENLTGDVYVVAHGVVCDA